MEGLCKRLTDEPGIIAVRVVSDGEHRTSTNDDTTMTPTLGTLGRQFDRKLQVGLIPTAGQRVVDGRSVRSYISSKHRGHVTILAWLAQAVYLLRAW